MSTLSSHYWRPGSVAEALALVAEDATILAGGTYVIAQGHHRRRRLVDLRALGLDYVSREEDGVRYGAMTTLQSLIDGQIPGDETEEVLADAARSTTSSWLLRNMSTVGGELVECARHSSLIVALLAVGAELVLATPGGQQRVRLDNFQGAVVDTAFILIEVVVPRAASSRVAFRSLAQLPTKEPIATAAVQLTINGHLEARVALGSSASRPARVPALELALMRFTRPAHNGELRDICARALDDFQFAQDHAAGTGYLRHASAVLLSRIIGELIEGEPELWK